MSRVAYHDGQRSGKQPVMRVNTDASQGNTRFFGNDGSDVGHDADVIVSHYAQGDGVLCTL